MSRTALLSDIAQPVANVRASSNDKHIGLNEKSAELFGFLLANAGKFGLVIRLPFQAGWGGYRAWPPPYPPLSLRAIPNCWTGSEKSFGENITGFGPTNLCRLDLSGRTAQRTVPTNFI